MKRGMVQKTFLVVMLGMFLCTPATFGQHEVESEVPTRVADREEDATRLAQQADQRRVVETDRKITFDEILADPDNVDLNLQYAKSQVSEGNLLGAASTLERILMVDSSLVQVRFFYAIVLFRLDNVNEAEIELNRLLELPLSQDAKSEIDKYLKEIRRRGRRTHLDVRESVGYQFDSNRNAAPSSKKRLFGDVLIDVGRENGRHYDSSLLNIANVLLSHDLPFQEGHQVFASFTYFLGEQFSLDALDLQSFQGEFGGTLKSDWVNITPAFFFGHTSLSRETFMRTQGGSLILDRRFFNKVDFYTKGTLAREDFVDITENLASHERAGDRMDATFGVRYDLIPTMEVLFEYQRVDKNAKEEYNAYTGNVLTLGHSWLLGKGQFLLNSIEFTRNHYEGPDSALAARERRDKTLRVQTTYGAPLAFFWFDHLMPDFMKDITLTFTYEYYRGFSNYTNYTYRNNKVQMMATKTLRF